MGSPSVPTMEEQTLRLKIDIICISKKCRGQILCDLLGDGRGLQCRMHWLYTQTIIVCVLLAVNRADSSGGGGSTVRRKKKCVLVLCMQKFIAAFLLQLLCFFFYFLFHFQLSFFIYFLCFFLAFTLNTEKLYFYKCSQRYALNVCNVGLKSFYHLTPSPNIQCSSSKCMCLP